MSRYADANLITQQLESAEEDEDFGAWNEAVDLLEHKYNDIPDVHNYLADNCLKHGRHRITVDFDNGEQRTYYVNDTMQSLAEYYTTGRECCIGRDDNTRATITAVKIERVKIPKEEALCLK